MTTEAQQTPFPEENTVYFKEIMKIQREIFHVETSTDMLYTEAEKLHAKSITAHLASRIHISFLHLYRESIFSSLHTPH